MEYGNVTFVIKNPIGITVTFQLTELTCTSSMSVIVIAFVLTGFDKEIWTWSKSVKVKDIILIWWEELSKDTEYFNIWKHFLSLLSSFNFYIKNRDAGSCII